LAQLSKLGAVACLFAAYVLQAQTTGTITTVVGNGSLGYSGDGGAALNANLNNPFSSVLSGGNLYIADQGNNVIREVSGGTISTVVGNGVNGYTGDNGKATSATLAKPQGIAVDSSGNLYIADTANQVIRKVTSGGTISTFAGTGLNPGYAGDGNGAGGALLFTPSAMVIDSVGNLYFCDTGNSVIRKIVLSTNTITTAVGTFANAGKYLGDGKPASQAGLSAPAGIALDSAGNIYIADTGNNVVRKVDASSLVISTVAGNGTPGFSGDGGRGVFAQLSHPKGVAVDSAGNVYISDTINSRIRMVTPNGIISTVVGTGQSAYFGDGGPGTSAAVNFPGGLLFDSSGKLYITDTVNNVIRVFTPTGSGGAKPVINSGGVVSASQFGQLTAIAPGSWIEIYGSNLASGTTDWSSAFQNGNINAPTVVGGTTVTVGGQSAFISYVSPGQVNAQVPSNVNPGTQQVVVSTSLGASAGVSVPVANTSPGLFAPANFVVGGKQYAGAQHQDGTWVMPVGAVSGFTSSPAKVGETITLFGVGFGPVNTGPQAGQIVQALNNITTPFNLFVGSIPVPQPYNYWGLAPQAIGLYQFNVVVPNVASGSAVPLTFILGSSSGTQTLYTAVQ
jgi:uncharacterized protein (TIGR03437 family)